MSPSQAMVALRTTLGPSSRGPFMDALLEALRRDIDPVFLPRPLYLVDALPRAANGKITRDGLEALLRRMTGR